MENNKQQEITLIPFIYVEDVISQLERIISGYYNYQSSFTPFELMDLAEKCIALIEK